MISQIMFNILKNLVMSWYSYEHLASVTLIKSSNPIKWLLTIDYIVLTIDYIDYIDYNDYIVWLC